MKNAGYILMCLLVLFQACRKKSNEQQAVVDAPKVSTELRSGLPDNSRVIHGYFYSSVKSSFGGSSYARSYAIFNDPGADLMITYDHNFDNTSFLQPTLGNIDAGEVLFSGMPLFTQNGGDRLSYLMIGTPTTSGNAGPTSWKTDGNGTFKPIDVVLQRGMPVVANYSTVANMNISRSTGITFNVADIASNFDSLIVSVSYSSTMIKKKIIAGTPVIEIKSSELSAFAASGYASISIYAYNYSNKTVEDKVYVFELSAKILATVPIMP